MDAPLYLRRICKTAGISIQELRGGDRSRDMAFRRFYVVNALHERGLSSLSIGELINRHHTTVLHALHAFPDSVYTWHRAERYRSTPGVRAFRARRRLMREAAE